MSDFSEDNGDKSETIHKMEIDDHQNSQDELMEEDGNNEECREDGGSKLVKQEDNEAGEDGGSKTKIGKMEEEVMEKGENDGENRQDGGSKVVKQETNEGEDGESKQKDEKMEDDESDLDIDEPWEETESEDDEEGKEKVVKEPTEEEKERVRKKQARWERRKALLLKRANEKEAKLKEKREKERIEKQQKRNERKQDKEYRNIGYMEERAMMFMRRFGRCRSFDFEEHFRHQYPFVHGPESEYQRDRLEQKLHRGKITESEFEYKYRRYGGMHSRHWGDEDMMWEYMMMEEKYRRRGERDDDRYGNRFSMFERDMRRFGLREQQFSSSSSDTSDNEEEEKTELDIRFDRYNAMTNREFHLVCALKSMFSKKVFLGDSYTIERLSGLSREIKDDIPFYTTMLNLAAKNGVAGCGRILLTKGARSSRPSGDETKNVTPLHIACQQNDKHFAEVLIKFKCKTVKRDDDGNTPLLSAMQHGACVDIIKLLLRKPQLKLMEHVNNEGLGLLNFHGLWHDRERYTGNEIPRSNAESLKTLLEYAKETGELEDLLNIRDKKTGRLPIHEATIVGNIENLKVLIEFGADIHSRVNHPGKNETLAHIAAQTLKPQILQVLLEAGVAPDGRCAFGQTPTVYILNGCYEMLFTIPMVDCLSLLVEHGAAINELVNEEGETLLHLAWNNPALAGVLVSYGGNVLKVNSRRVSPLLFSSPAVYRLFEKEAHRLKSLTECCKWTIRQSMGQNGAISHTTRRLPIPKYLQDYIKAVGHDKPQFPKMSDNKTEKTDNKTIEIENFKME